MALILLADDDPLVEDIVKATLCPKGHIVGVLPNGQGLVELVELKRPALVILDCLMPVVGGVAALRKIRASRTCPNVPVLMLTARTSYADEAIAMEAGATDYLRKPFEPDQLGAWVDCLIDSHSSIARGKRVASVWRPHSGPLAPIAAERPS